MIELTKASVFIHVHGLPVPKGEFKGFSIGHGKDKLRGGGFQMGELAYKSVRLQEQKLSITYWL